MANPPKARGTAATDERLAGRTAAAPATLEEALARARRHGRAAATEALACARALLDALSLAGRGQPVDDRGALGWAAQLLDALGEELNRASDGDPTPVFAGVAEALDAEINRWEFRARDDVEARAVLRVFLGLREVLWEFGLLRGAAPASRDAARDASAPPRRKRRRSRRTVDVVRKPPRVQRVPVEG